MQDVGWRPSWRRCPLCATEQREDCPICEGSGYAEIYGIKTAMRRKAPSAPAKWLQEAGLLRSPVLDYGCGYGRDVDYLRSCGLEAMGFDPWYRPTDVHLVKRFATVLVSYVFNVVPPRLDDGIWSAVRAVLADDGVAYATVRRDLPPRGGLGAGAWQRNVSFDFDVVRETGKHAIYRVTREML